MGLSGYRTRPRSYRQCHHHPGELADRSVPRPPCPVRGLLRRDGSAVPTRYDPNFQYVLTTAEDNAITGSIKVWTFDELLNTIGAGLLKSVSDTVTNIEAPNIVGRNVTLLASGGIGITQGQTTISLLNKPVQFTDEERVALSSAERVDVTYLGGAPSRGA